MAAVLDFCTPAVPGETHKYYGYSHNKYIKLPHINAIPIINSSPTLKQQHKSKEHKTLRSVALSGNLALLRQFLQMVPDQLKAVNDPHPATGLTCLHFAASRGHLKIVTCLVEEYAVRVDSTDKEGEVKPLFNENTRHSSNTDQIDGLIKSCL
jgi:ankyrin repeat protein